MTKTGRRKPENLNESQLYWDTVKILNTYLGVMKQIYIVITNTNMLLKYDKNR